MALKCEVCEKQFRSWPNLLEHRRTHTQYRPYMCNIGSCLKTFSTLSKLQLHRLRHDDKRLFKCRVCQMKFLASHHRKLHRCRPGGSPVHRCHFCSATFNRILSLSYHIQKHHHIFRNKLWDRRKYKPAGKSGKDNEEDDNKKVLLKITAGKSMTIISPVKKPSRELKKKHGKKKSKKKRKRDSRSPAPNGIILSIKNGAVKLPEKRSKFKTLKETIAEPVNGIVKTSFKVDDLKLRIKTYPEISISPKHDNLNIVDSVENPPSDNLKTVCELQELEKEDTTVLDLNKNSEMPKLRNGIVIVKDKSGKLSSERLQKVKQRKKDRENVFDSLRDVEIWKVMPSPRPDKGTDILKLKFSPHKPIRIDSGIDMECQSRRYLEIPDKPRGELSGEDSDILELPVFDKESDNALNNVNDSGIEVLSSSSCNRSNGNSVRSVALDENSPLYNFNTEDSLLSLDSPCADVINKAEHSICHRCGGIVLETNNNTHSPGKCRCNFSNPNSPFQTPISPVKLSDINKSHQDGMEGTASLDEHIPSLLTHKAREQNETGEIVESHAEIKKYNLSDGEDSDIMIISVDDRHSLTNSPEKPFTGKLKLKLRTRDPSVSPVKKKTNECVDSKSISCLESSTVHTGEIQSHSKSLFGNNTKQIDSVKTVGVENKAGDSEVLKTKAKRDNGKTKKDQKSSESDTLKSASPNRTIMNARYGTVNSPVVIDDDDDSAPKTVEINTQSKLSRKKPLFKSKNKSCKQLDLSKDEESNKTKTEDIGKNSDNEKLEDKHEQLCVSTKKPLFKKSVSVEEGSDVVKKKPLFKKQILSTEGQDSSKAKTPLSDIAIAKTSLPDKAKTPVSDKVETPLSDRVKTHVSDDKAKTPVADKAKTSLSNKAKTPLSDGVKTHVSDDKAKKSVAIESELRKHENEVSDVKSKTKTENSNVNVNRIEKSKKKKNSVKTSVVTKTDKSATDNHDKVIKKTDTLIKITKTEVLKQASSKNLEVNDLSAKKQDSSVERNARVEKVSSNDNVGENDQKKDTVVKVTVTKRNIGKSKLTSVTADKEDEDSFQQFPLDDKVDNVSTDDKSMESESEDGKRKSSVSGPLGLFQQQFLSFLCGNRTSAADGGSKKKTAKNKESSASVEKTSEKLPEESVKSPVVKSCNSEEDSATKSDSFSWLRIFGETNNTDLNNKEKTEENVDLMKDLNDDLALITKKMDNEDDDTNSLDMVDVFGVESLPTPTSKSLPNKQSNLKHNTSMVVNKGENKQESPYKRKQTAKRTSGKFRTIKKKVELDYLYQDETCDSDTSDIRPNPIDSDPDFNPVDSGDDFVVSAVTAKRRSSRACSRSKRRRTITHASSDSDTESRVECEDGNSDNESLSSRHRRTKQGRKSCCPCCLGETGQISQTHSKHDQYHKQSYKLPRNSKQFIKSTLRLLELQEKLHGLFLTLFPDCAHMINGCRIGTEEFDTLIDDVLSGLGEPETEHVPMYQSMNLDSKESLLKTEYNECPVNNIGLAFSSPNLASRTSEIDFEEKLNEKLNSETPEPLLPQCSPPVGSLRSSTSLKFENNTLADDCSEGSASPCKDTHDIYSADKSIVSHTPCTQESLQTNSSMSQSLLAIATSPVLTNSTNSELTSNVSAFSSNCGKTVDHVSTASMSSIQTVPSSAGSSDTGISSQLGSSSPGTQHPLTIPPDCDSVPYDTPQYYSQDESVPLVQITIDLGAAKVSLCRKPKDCLQKLHNQITKLAHHLLPEVEFKNYFYKNLDNLEFLIDLLIDANKGRDILLNDELDGKSDSEVKSYWPDSAADPESENLTYSFIPIVTDETAVLSEGEPLYVKCHDLFEQEIKSQRESLKRDLFVIEEDHYQAHHNEMPEKLHSTLASLNKIAQQRQSPRKRSRDGRPRKRSADEKRTLFVQEKLNNTHNSTFVCTSYTNTKSPLETNKTKQKHAEHSKERFLSGLNLGDKLENGDLNETEQNAVNEKIKKLSEMVDQSNIVNSTEGRQIKTILDENVEDDLFRKSADKNIFELMLPVQ